MIVHAAIFFHLLMQAIGVEEQTPLHFTHSHFSHSACNSKLPIVFQKEQVLNGFSGKETFKTLRMDTHILELLEKRLVKLRVFNDFLYPEQKIHSDRTVFQAHTLVLHVTDTI